MSLPTGAKVLSAIDVNTYTYLTGVNQVVTGWNSAQTNFEAKGKPAANLDRVEVTLEDIQLINQKLPENQPNFIFSDNGVFSTSNVCEDLKFTDNPTQEYNAWVTFIDEGAGYKNSLGYYFYIIDGNGDVVILDNDDATNANGTLGHYRPTVIFPNASSVAGGRLRSDGVLLPGHKRQLKGNLANGKFQNINVGFFLVPNGWSDSLGVRYNNKAILHTNNTRNPNYVDGAVGAANYGYQSVLFNFNSGENYVIAFEDIQRPSGDSDFNDLIIRTETDPIINLTETATVSQPTIDSNCLQKTKLGLVFVGNTADLPNINDADYRYKFKRTINCDSSFNRDRYLEIYTGNYLNFEFPTTAVASGNQAVEVTYVLPSSDLLSNATDGKIQLYLLLTDNNRDDEVIVDATNPDPNEQTQFNKLVLMQRLENDNVLNESYQLDEYDVNDEVGTNSTLKTESNQIPRNTIGSSLIWGDPHIKKITGEIITLATDTGTHTYFETDKVKIEVDFDFYRDHDIPVYRDFSFIKTSRFVDKSTQEQVEIDMFSPNLPVNDPAESAANSFEKVAGGSKGGCDCVAEASACPLFEVMDVSDIKCNTRLRAKLLNLLSFDSEVKVKVVQWKGSVNFWVIFYPTNTSFFNEIYIDQSELLKVSNQHMGGLIV